MDKARPAGFAVLIALMSTATVALVSVSFARFPGHLLGAALLFALVTAVVEWAPVRVRPDIQGTLGNVVMFTAIPFLGLPGAVVTGFTAGLVAGWQARSDRGAKLLFNVGMFVIAASMAALAFSLVMGLSIYGGEPAAALERPGTLTLALLAAGAAYSLGNTVLVSLVVHLTAGVPLRATLREVAVDGFRVQFLYVGISAIAYTLLVRVGPESLVLLIVPLLVARQSLLTVQRRQEAFDRMVGTFVAAIQAKDGYTRGHAERVSELSVLVAERMGLSYDERQLIRYGAILHDVGKIGVSIGVLCKAGPLTDDEYGEMKLHPEIGAEMLSDIDFLKPALAIVEHHHERLDGRGYPAGLEGDDIPLLTRIVTAVDAFDAMTSTRPYRRALPVSVAVEELQANAGTQFCPRVVDHLVAVIAERGWELTDVPVHAIPMGESS